MEPCRCGPADDVTPEPFKAIAVVAKWAAVRAVGLGGVQRPRLRGDTLANPLEIVPVFLALSLVVL